MAKQLCIIGPRDSGKTIFIYHMNFKMILANYLGNIPTFKDIVANNFDEDIQAQFNGGDWIKKTPEVNGKTEHPQITFKRNTFLPNELCLDIPDVAGEMFEAVIKSPGPEYTPVLEAIKRAHGYVLLIDLAKLKKNNGMREEHLGFYTRFISNFRNFTGLRNAERCGRPTLVLLNKSDIVTKDIEEQFKSEGAEEYIFSNYQNLYVQLVNTFHKECLQFAWHSNITKVKKRNGTKYPDYGAFFTADSEVYIRSFIKLVNKLQ